MQDIFDGLKGYINERLNSPLIASYVFAWVIFNYRVPVLLVSDMKVHVKLAMIDTYLHSSMDQVLYVYGWPAVIASIYVFIAQIPTTLATAWTLLHQNILAKVQQVILRRRIVTEDELAERESIVRERVDSLQQKLHQAEERVGALRLARETAEAEARDFKKQLENKIDNEAEIARLSESLASSALQLNQVKNEKENALAEVKSTLELLKSERIFARDLVATMLSNMRDDEAKNLMAIILNDAHSIPSSPDWVNELVANRSKRRKGLLDYQNEDAPKQ